MSEPEWLELDIVLDFHAEQLALFGGPDGIRDVGLLESALARPANKFAYGETSLAALAAAYGFGIAGTIPSSMVTSERHWPPSSCSLGLTDSGSLRRVMKPRQSC